MIIKMYPWVFTIFTWTSPPFPLKPSMHNLKETWQPVNWGSFSIYKGAVNWKRVEWGQQLLIYGGSSSFNWKCQWMSGCYRRCTWLQYISGSIKQDYVSEGWYINVRWWYMGSYWKNDWPSVIGGAGVFALGDLSLTAASSVQPAPTNRRTWLAGLHQLINQRKLPRVCCSPISGVTRLPGVRAWVFLHKQGAGYKFGGVATYRRCTNIPREEMRCQGALEIERGGVNFCHRDSWAELGIGMGVKGWVRPIAWLELSGSKSVSDR